VLGGWRREVIGEAVQLARKGRHESICAVFRRAATRTLISTSITTRA
jgi:hypothetical protein